MALNRRELFRTGGALAGAGAIQSSSGQLSAAPLTIGEDIYQSIGVKPLVNCMGTFTIISGSQSLPEVKSAMDAASRHYVNMDELMDAVGHRLAELTGAEWGLVTAGCAAAMTHVTAACLAGSDPEKMQRLPNLQGMRNEVILPKYSRDVYDHAIRMLGVKMVEVNSLSEYEAAFNERTAMIRILAGPGDDGQLGTQALSGLARQKGVPLFVDAAAEDLTIPNIHLQRGATVVAYSGGKCLRGPQSAGLALGEKNLLQAAWANSAPHHAFGRSLKVGKEEIMGMLAAVEMWTRRDHKAEWRQWESWLQQISARVTKVDGVTTNVVQPHGLSNHAPTLVIEWDPTKLGITGHQLSKHLLDTEPRVILAGARDSSPTASSVRVMPYMMMPGDDKVAAERLYSALSSPPAFSAPAKDEGTPANVDGQWEARIDFQRGSAGHSFILEQQGSSLKGTHRGEILSGDLHGEVGSNTIGFRSSQRVEGTRLEFHFSGNIEGDTMEGTVELGEYGSARWSAKRHKYS